MNSCFLFSFACVDQDVWFTSFHLDVIVVDFQLVMSVAVVPSDRNTHVLRKLKYLHIPGLKGESTLKGGNSDAHYTKEVKRKNSNITPNPP